MIATPFRGGMDCWNAADWMVIISPVCLFLLPILFFFINRQVKNKKKMIAHNLDKYHKWYEKYKKIEKGLGRK